MIRYVNEWLYLFIGRVIFFRKDETFMQEGFSYHIKDAYFQTVDAHGLMRNKENGGHRPHYYCIEDENVRGLYWVIPISSKVEKYEALRLKKIKRNGICKHDRDRQICWKRVCIFDPKHVSCYGKICGSYSYG